jgi:hypothetical protein
MRSARAVGEFKNHLRAKKRLMETHPSSKGRSSLSKQRALKILIETINAISEIVLSDPTTRHKPLAPGSDHEPGSRWAVSARYRDTAFLIVRKKRTADPSSAKRRPLSG